MAKLLGRLLVTVILFISTLPVIGQDSSRNTLNAAMRSHNKIYVVMAVCLTILIGLILYLVRIDGKIGKSERGVL